MLAFHRVEIVAVVAAVLVAAAAAAVVAAVAVVVPLAMAGRPFFSRFHSLW